MNGLILFYDSQWGVRPNVPPSLPDRFQVTFDRTRYAQAGAVVFHLPTWKWRRWLGMPPKLPGQLWIAWTQESDENYPYQRDPEWMSRFDFRMTYQSDADVFLPYCAFSDLEDIRQLFCRPPQPKLNTPLVAMVISSRINASKRFDYLRELARYLPIDSYGKFMRNNWIANDRGGDSKREIYARHKFAIAFENACDQDYVTEKFYDPLIAGTVPVYLGAPNIDQFAPGDHCFINAAQSSPRILAEYLNSLAHDDTAYNTFFEWKQKPLRENFTKLIKDQSVHWLVRLCLCIQSRLML